MEFVNEESHPCLLYVGALTDAFPLTIPSIRQRYSTIIYTDGMPGSQYYQHKSLESEQKILAILKEEGGSLAMVSEFSFNDADGSYDCQLKDNCTIKYFFNMDNIDVNIIPIDLLGRIKALWMHGYELPQEEVQKLNAPGDMVLYVAPECVDDEDRFELQFKEVHVIPSILHWDSGYNVAQLLDEQQHLLLRECEAPYVILEEDPSDDEEGEQGNESEEGERKEEA